jgi:hypothetical protein
MMCSFAGSGFDSTVHSKPHRPCGLSRLELIRLTEATHRPTAIIKTLNFRLFKPPFNLFLLLPNHRGNIRRLNTYNTTWARTSHAVTALPPIINVQRECRQHACILYICLSWPVTGNDRKEVLSQTARDLIPNNLIGLWRSGCSK